MKHVINRVAVIFTDRGEPTIEAYTDKRLVGTVSFADNPPDRVIIPVEPREPFQLHFPTSMRTLVFDLLRSGADVEFDREDRTLRFGNARL